MKNIKKFVYTAGVLVGLVILTFAALPVIQKIQRQMYVRKELKNPVVINLCNKIYTDEFLEKVLKQSGHYMNRHLKKCEDKEKNILYDLSTFASGPSSEYYDIYGNRIGSLQMPDLVIRGQEIVGECTYKGKKCLEYNTCGPIICCKGDNCKEN